MTSRFSTSSRIEPACCMIVVESPSFFWAGTPTTEFGETRIISSPRFKRTRPVRPVRTVSPGFNTSSCFSDACCTPLPVSHTSPEDLLTVQSPPSAAKATVAVANMNMVASALET